MSESPYYIWLSVSNDAGIEFMSIGNLARGEQLSPIISGTLSALKEVVTSEISDQPGTFMTGTTEVSAFGNYTIETGFKNNIVVSYMIIKKYAEQEIDLKTIYFLQQLCIALGEQFLNELDFKELNDLGKRVEDYEKTRLFLDAIDIAKTKVDFTTDDTFFDTLVEKTVIRLIEINEPRIAGLDILRNFQEHVQDLQYNLDGFLTVSSILTLINFISNQLLMRLIDEDPYVFFCVSNTRALSLKIESLIRTLLKKFASRIKSEFNKTCRIIMRENVDLLINDLKLSEQHTAHHLIAAKIIKKSLAELAKFNPMYILYPLTYRDLNFKLKEIIKEKISVKSLSRVIKEILEGHLNKTTIDYVVFFIDSFLAEYETKPLTTSTWTIIIKFLTSLIKKEKLEELIKKNTEIEKRFREELLTELRKFEDKIIIGSYEEGLKLFNAFNKVIFKTLSEIYVTQFIVNGRVGKVIMNYMNHASYIAPRLLLGNLLAAFFGITCKGDSKKVFKHGCLPSFHEIFYLGMISNLVEVAPSEGVKIKSGFLRRSPRIVWNDVKYPTYFFARLFEGMIKLKNKVVEKNELFTLPSLTDYIIVNSNFKEHLIELIVLRIILCFRREIRVYINTWKLSRIS